MAKWIKLQDPLLQIQTAAIAPLAEGIRIDGITKLIPKYEELAMELNAVIDSILLNSATSLVAIEESFPDTPIGNAMATQAGTTKMQSTGYVIQKLLDLGR